MPVFQDPSSAAAGEVKLEALSQPIYDQQNVPSSSVSTVTAFFQNPNGRSLLFTNLESAGSLTWPKRFSIKAFRLIPNPAGAVAADIANFYILSFCRLKIGEKDYFVCPAFLLTPGVAIEVSTATAATAVTGQSLNFTHNGRPDHRNLYVLQHQIWIPSVQNFTFRLETAGLTVSASSTGSDGTASRLSTWVFLEGELFREVQ